MKNLTNSNFIKMLLIYTDTPYKSYFDKKNGVYHIDLEHPKWTHIFNEYGKLIKSYVRGDNETIIYDK